MPSGLRRYWEAKKKARGNGRSMLTGPGWASASARLSSSAAPKPLSRAVTAAKNPHKKKRKKMKLYGAAAKAHAKRLSKLRRKRHNPRKHGRRKRRNQATAAPAVVKNPRRGRGRRRNPRKPRFHQAVTALKMFRAYRTVSARRVTKQAKAYRRRYRMGAKRWRGKKMPPLSIRLKGSQFSPRIGRKKRRKNPSRRRNTWVRSRRNPSRRRHARRARRNPYGRRSMMRARGFIRSRYQTAGSLAVRKKYRLRSNPGVGGLPGTLMAAIKGAAPIALALYGSRALSGKFAGKIPGINKLPANLQGPAMAGVVALIGHMATGSKWAPAMLRKHRSSIMLGVGLNMVDSLFAAFAPANVKSMFGLSDIYDNGLSDYVQVGDYLQVGDTPIDDDITLSDYVQVGALQEELGVEEELGLQEELGLATDNAFLGGTSSDSLLRTVGTTPMVANVPDRSFTRDVRHAGSGYDKADVLYGGVFSGGF
jgi:hypothetical protein